MAYSDGLNLAEKLSNLGYAELLDSVEAQLRASDALYYGGYGGLVYSLEDGLEGNLPDGVGMFKHGVDRPGSTNVPKTIVSEAHMANKEQTSEDPASLHVLVDWGERYLGSTGEYTLANLARLAVAMTCIAIEDRSTAALSLTIVGREIEPKVFDDEEVGHEAMDKLEAYDGYVDSKVELKKDDKPTTLNDGLELLLDAEQANPDNSVCLIVSDLILGKLVDRRGNITGFDWQPNLGSLAEIYGDRLFITRLTSPDQVYLPLDHTYSDGRRTFSFDSGDGLEFAYEYYREGKAKAELIARALGQLRVVELSSTDKTPLATMSDFLFGSQDNE